MLWVRVEGSLSGYGHKGVRPLRRRQRWAQSLRHKWIVLCVADGVACPVLLSGVEGGGEEGAARASSRQLRPACGCGEPLKQAPEVLGGPAFGVLAQQLFALRCFSRLESGLGNLGKLDVVIGSSQLVTCATPSI